MKTLAVDTEASTITWKGMKNAEYFHTGTVKFADGSAEFIDGNLTSGSFNVDMGTIAVTDQTPDDKKAMLVGHLGTPEFFDIANNAKVSVSSGAYSDGTLPVTIKMSGKEITQNVAVKVTYKDDKGSITGNFDIDFSSLDVVGFKPAKGETEFVQPTINFDLNLQLK